MDKAYKPNGKVELNVYLYIAFKKYVTSSDDQIIIKVWTNR